MFLPYTGEALPSPQVFPGETVIHFPLDSNHRRAAIRLASEGHGRYWQASDGSVIGAALIVNNEIDEKVASAIVLSEHPLQILGISTDINLDTVGNLYMA